MPREADDAGTTLIEVLVTAILLSVISGLTLFAFVSAQQVVRNSDDESIGLTDVRVVIERMGRDIRDARAVVCIPDTSVTAPGDTSCGAHLNLWIDTNSNYRLDTGETIEWKLIPEAGGVHFDVVRKNLDTGVVQTEATTLVVQFAFGYDVTPTASATNSKTALVRTGMTYDARVGNGVSSRTVEFSDRLRNQEN